MNQQYRSRTNQSLISAFIPYEKSIKDALDPSIISLLPSEVASLPFKVEFWFLGSIVMVLLAYTCARALAFDEAQTSLA